MSNESISTNHITRILMFMISNNKNIFPPFLKRSNCFLNIYYTVVSCLCQKYSHKHVHITKALREIHDIDQYPHKSREKVEKSKIMQQCRDMR